MRHTPIGLFIALWISVGAATTVGATWLGIICAYGWGWEPGPGLGPTGGKIDSGVKFPWPHTPPSHWLPAATARWNVRSLWSDHITYLSETGGMFDHRAGLPVRCLACWEIKDGLYETPSQRRTHGSIPARLNVRNRQFLPIVPLWPGFAINTLFYAAVAFGLWSVPVALYRRRRRRLRGQAGRCPNCNYDRAGLAAGAACPECGACSPT